MSAPFVFVFGRTPDLSFAEVASFFPLSSIDRISPYAATVHLPIPDPQEMIDTLGGAVRIAIPLEVVPSLTPDSIAQCILHDAVGTKVTSGISTFGDYSLPSEFLAEVKEIVEGHGLKVRFVKPQEGNVLSSVVISGQKVLEYCIIPVENGVQIARTVATQTVWEWSKRDTGRPHIDAKRGMLPLKVARMAVNIAVGKDAAQKVILDPFCGIGSVLSEAYMRGIETYGCDLDESAARQAEQNLQWLAKTSTLSNQPKFHCSVGNAVHVSTVFPGLIVDAIVTEPFMGNTAIGLHTPVTSEKIENIVKGLTKLYIGCLKEWHDILKTDGVIIIALPSFSVNEREYFVKKVVDSCENFGYSINGGPFTYSRPQAVVKRNFYIFKKK